ncbi:MAG: glycerate kinase [Christensenellaceae bacterium]|jgi:glycerate kinase|nr:glycerate kinase [Christensenellaceae bacterium]
MRILVCPDSFKGTLSASEAANIIAVTMKKRLPNAETVLIPLADGGEGTAEALSTVFKGEFITVKTTDSLNREISAQYLLCKNSVAVIETAEAMGLPQLSSTERDPEKTSSFGAGLLIKDAVRRGATDIYLTLGGSATNDCFFGALAALGAEFYTNGVKIGIPCGGDLSKIDKIVLSSEFKSLVSKTKFTAMCDVNNPPYGLNGAAHIYAPQKGANCEAVERLDEGVKSLVELLVKEGFATNALHTLVGGGAAGASPVGITTLLNGKIQSGITTVLTLTSFVEAAKTCDAIIVGEGKLDKQSFMGKVIDGVISVLKKNNLTPEIYAACGLNALTEAEYTAQGLSFVSACDDGSTPFEVIKKTARERLEAATAKLCRLIVAK